MSRKTIETVAVVTVVLVGLLIGSALILRKNEGPKLEASTPAEPETLSVVYLDGVDARFHLEQSDFRIRSWGRSMFVARGLGKHGLDHFRDTRVRLLEDQFLWVRFIPQASAPTQLAVTFSLTSGEVTFPLNGKESDYSLTSNGYYWEVATEDQIYVLVPDRVVRSARFISG